MLVARGANVNAMGKDGNTTLKRAIATNRVKIINLLKQSGAVLEDNYEEGQKMIKAVKDGKIEEVQQFFAKGLDVNIRDSAQWTPLMYVSRNGNCDIVKLLISSEYNLGETDCLNFSQNRMIC